jgi:drug/metabolite transporter, DME family
VRAYDPAVLQVSWLGALVGLSTGMAHAGYVLFSQRSVESHSPWTSLAYTMLFGSLALLALWLVGAPGSATATAAPSLIGSVGGLTPWLVLLGLALGPTLGGYALFTTALRYIPGRIASLVVVVEAPISVLLAMLLLGERLEWAQILGIALILGSIGLPRLLARDERRPATDVRQPPTEDRVLIQSADG